MMKYETSRTFKVRTCETKKIRKQQVTIVRTGVRVKTTSDKTETNHVVEEGK